jgi:hypothetical protein
MTVQNLTRYSVPAKLLYKIPGKKYFPAFVPENQTSIETFSWTETPDVMKVVLCSGRQIPPDPGQPKKPALADVIPCYSGFLSRNSV